MLALEKSTSLQLSLTIYVLLWLVKEAEFHDWKEMGVGVCASMFARVCLSVCVCVCVCNSCAFLLSLHSSHGGDRVPLITEHHSLQTKAHALTVARVQYR